VSAEKDTEKLLIEEFELLNEQGESEKSEGGHTDSDGEVSNEEEEEASQELHTESLDCSETMVNFNIKVHESDVPASETCIEELVCNDHTTKEDPEEGEIEE
jgi:hypothetical protein